ncbi:MAG: hypothetical protein KTR23_18075 [Rhodospirillales bacterium]|nr:hypothetical protein [Rhodospirillales bacterium]
MEPLGSQLPIYTKTAGAIAPQNRLIVPDDQQSSTQTSNSDRNAASLRNANYTAEKLRGSLGGASDLLSQASSDLSRIGDALDEIDALVEIVEENSDLSRQQRAQLNAQIEDYLAQIDDIAANSSFDDKNLLADDQTITLQVGSGTSVDNRLDVELYASASDDLATGLSSIDVSDNAGVTAARTLVDEAQEALRDRQISLSADRGSVATAQDQSRISQVASDNILQAQLAAAEPSQSESNQARISENLQAYLGDISSQLASQTVTVGGFALPEPQREPQPEPRPDPFLEQNDAAAFDPNAEQGNGVSQDFFGSSSTFNAPNPSYSATTFGGYDSGGSGTSGSSSGGGGGSSERPASRVSVDA